MKEVIIIAPHGFVGLVEHQLNGLIHRVNGPALFSDGDSMGDWWLNGVEHRYYGPASNLIGEWWIHGMHIKSENVFW